MIRGQKKLFQSQAFHNALINPVSLQQCPTGIIGELDDLLQREQFTGVVAQLNW
jgi:hypothetical protein